MKILVTGALGFVGKNVCVTLQNLKHELYQYDRDNTIDQLREWTKDCDFVIHLAGINRPENPSEFYEGNAGFTEVLCSLLRQHNNKAPILVSSSIQALRDNDYGKSKLEGEKMIIEHGQLNQSKVLIYRFENLYGKWSRPNYNSVIATWCYNIANNLEIQVNDRSAEIQFLYIDDVVKEIIRALDGKENRVDDAYCICRPIDTISLGELERLIYSFKESRNNLAYPDLKTPFAKKLYSTYLSYLPKDQFSYPLKMNVDHRGSFTEFLKDDFCGQVSVNVSKPNITKGQHWHHSKNEKFLVVYGKGLIQFRQIFSDEIIEYYVSGDKLEVVDIPTGYTHNIINVGDTDMVTIMWANEKFDPENPDTYYLEV